MDIVLASRNKNKIKELQLLLDNSGVDINVLSLNDINYFDDIEEDGKSFYENALIKASVPASLGYIGVSDDSGVCVDYLNGQPGIYSARYAGEHGNDEDNNNKLLDELKGVDDADRSAQFVSVIACVIPEGVGFSLPDTLLDKEASEYLNKELNISASAFCTKGVVDGKILFSPIGNGGFGYDPIFYVTEKDKSYAQLTDSEKNEVSHRGKAFRKFIEIIKKGI